MANSETRFRIQEVSTHSSKFMLSSCNQSRAELFVDEASLNPRQRIPLNRSKDCPSNSGAPAVFRFPLGAKAETR